MADDTVPPTSAQRNKKGALYNKKEKEEKEKEKRIEKRADKLHVVHSRNTGASLS